MVLLRSLFVPLAAALVASSSEKSGGGFIIELDEKSTTLDAFTQSASAINYTVRRTFKTPGIFTGIAIDIADGSDLKEAKSRLDAIPGVVGVADIIQYEIPPIKSTSVSPPSAGSSLTRRGDVSGDLGFTLQMGGVDKAHALGIKGKGISIGFIDTGVYYDHPALGGGFGSGKKIVGGYSFITDEGHLVDSDDPYSDCPQSDHATHVAGIIGMDPLQAPDGFPISGVAPEASLYAYRIFGCGLGGGAREGGTTDLVLQAMLKAFEDGVDIITTAQQIKNAGVAIIVAMGNDASGSLYANNLYIETFPGELSSVVAVASIANSNYPLVYTATDKYGAKFHYSNPHPISATEGLDVYLLPGDACDTIDWNGVVDDIQTSGNLSTTVIALSVSASCTLSGISCCGNTAPPYLLGFYGNDTNPYDLDYESILPYRFNNGSTQAYTVLEPDSDTFFSNYNASGGYGKYKLFFGNSTYINPKQGLGGIVDSYSDWGPIRLTYELKPQIAAPGGHILSTFPESIGSYGVISGTSMATPYIAACFALVKSQFPDWSVDEILVSLQTTAQPTAWAWNQSMLAATAQQGAGLVNVYDAITTATRVSPGQLAATDNNSTSFGLVNITVENNGNSTQTYTLGHRGAGYTFENVGYGERDQMANFGTAEFATPTLELEPGETTEIPIRLSYPPLGIDVSRLPLFSGYIDVVPETGVNLSIPYIGPGFSPYNMDYITYLNATPTYPGLPWLSFPNNSGTNYNDGFSSVDSSRQYSFSVHVQQFTNLSRVDIVPANTTLKAHFNAANFTFPSNYTYLASSNQPKSTLFGEPSYGNLWIAQGLTQPESISLGGKGLKVKDDSGANVTLGSGDYRWFFSILRLGGDATLIEDYDTWLGPIVRLLD
ncbi:peptidase [Trichoderma gamsii]|uniref:Peptidase n=1 Tax=Trichoderma gamsii TaxID=398673 RepID=A0A2P4ZV91_9HYPO|nr:peptidase [Trichoderma gamsii]PON28188.1 peptidase [Trichoderma gamsii]